jgi:hypothetical protein
MLETENLTISLSNLRASPRFLQTRQICHYECTTGVLCSGQKTNDYILFCQRPRQHETIFLQK